MDHEGNYIHRDIVELIQTAIVKCPVKPARIYLGRWDYITLAHAPLVGHRLGFNAVTFTCSGLKIYVVDDKHHIHVSGE